MCYKISYRALSTCYTYVYLSRRLIGYIDHQNSCVIVTDAHVIHSVIHIDSCELKTVVCNDTVVYINVDN